MRKDDNIHNSCRMSVNSINFQIQQKGASRKGNAFGLHKYAGKSALQYKRGICICTGHLVWIQGLYPAGKFNDITIFNKVLVNFLDLYERMEVDSGYRGHPRYIKCPENGANPPENLAVQRASSLIMRHSMED
jgi:hypothetical protein